MPCVLNEIVIKCFNIEVTKGSREADMASYHLNDGEHRCDVQNN